MHPFYRQPRSRAHCSTWTADRTHLSAQLVHKFEPCLPRSQSVRPAENSPWSGACIS